jgi:hypothetical protein
VLVDQISALAADVDALAAVDVEQMPVRELMALVAAAAPLADRLAGIASRAVGELQARGGGTVPGNDGGAAPLPGWLRDVAHVSGRQAGQRVRTAEALRALPHVADAVVDGCRTAEHGRALARLVARIPDPALTASQHELLEVARRTDPDQLAHYVRHLLATWCEPELEQQEDDAVAGRFLQLTNKHNGRVRGVFELPDADAEVLLTVLEPLARRDGLDDRRTAGQRRADALVDIAGLALRRADLPAAAGSRPRLTYVLPTPSTRITADALPAAASAAWTGPATRATVERLLCDAATETLTLAGSGRILDLSSSSGEITAAQRRAVAARDRCCTAKGCTRPPSFCDVHHLRAREHGGATEADNLTSPRYTRSPTTRCHAGAAVSTDEGGAA